MIKILKPLVIALLLVGLFSCSVSKKITKNLKKEDSNSSMFKGFVVYNPSTKKELVNFHGEDYFTPASNTKLFTFYTAYQILKDSIKSLSYYKSNDSLVLMGMADPTLLVNGNTKVIDFLKKESKVIYLVNKEIDEAPLGNGWSWDDYQDYYMPEKSILPMYGNILKYTVSGDSLSSIPSLFKKNIDVLDSISNTREIEKNQFYAINNRDETYEVPFKTSIDLSATLLGDAINKEVKIIPYKAYNFKIIYGEQYDSIFKKMLVVSDNFIAEQLMLQVGKQVSGKYSVKEAINFSLDSLLPNLPQKPKWVDGSGLSRYNLFSPNDMVYLLNKMYQEIPLPKLLNFFPVGGKSGTLKNWYGNKEPYVYAKSGSLSNNYCLSGYLITKKGNLLIFSYMNNHFTQPTSEIRKSIEKTLELIYRTY